MSHICPRPTRTHQNELARAIRERFGHLKALAEDVPFPTDFSETARREQISAVALAQRFGQDCI